jgi:hypothetical protein
MSAPVLETTATERVDVPGGYEIRTPFMTSFYPDPGTVPTVNRRGRQGFVVSVHQLHLR